MLLILACLPLWSSLLHCTNAAARTWALPGCLSLVGIWFTSFALPPGPVLKARAALLTLCVCRAQKHADPLTAIASGSVAGGWLKAVDFGCAQAVQQRPLVRRTGTPVFMAPEVRMSTQKGLCVAAALPCWVLLV